jgi:hypothetical protein
MNSILYFLKTHMMIVFFYHVLEILTNLNCGKQSKNPKTIVQEGLYFISMTLFYSANKNEN